MQTSDSRSMQSKKVPLFIFEEHNEAFFIWHYAAMNNIIQKSSNTLLHVDEHSDLTSPKFNFSIKSINNNKLQDIYNFTYKELTIASFIFPAIYQGLFSHLYWLYQTNHEGKQSKKSVSVYSHQGQGKALVTNLSTIHETGTLAWWNPDLSNALFQCIKTDAQLPQHLSVILDIDLDYFSCNSKFYNFRGQLEITKEEYQSFIVNKHHFLRCILGSSIQSKIENDKYYLLFNSLTKENLPNKRKVSQQEIINRIDALIKFLKKNKIKPQLIDICRSRISGFTPEDQCIFIEENLIKKLKTLYELEVSSIEDIFTQENICLNLALN